MLGLVAGCGNNRNDGPTPPIRPSVAAQVWSPADGFVSWPRLPVAAPGRTTWSLNLASTYLSGSYAVPDGPAVPGRIVGVTSAGRLVGYDMRGHQVWQTALPALQGTVAPDSDTLVDELWAPGLLLFAVDRRIADAGSDDQIDVFDGTTGRFLWSRVGSQLNAPTVLDAHRLLFDLTDSLHQGERGLDAVDALTGKLLWHNQDVAACAVYTGQVLCTGAGASAAVLLDPDTGATRWTVPYPETPQGALFSDSAIVDGRVYLSDGQSDTLTAIDVTSGHVLWRQHTDITQIDGIEPLDAGHVAVSGLSGGGFAGSNEVIDTIGTANGAISVLYRSTATSLTGTSEGGVQVVTIDGTWYALDVDPDGGAHVLDARGNQVATAANACDSSPSVVGDTFGCTSDGTLTIYALPDLAHRATLTLPGAGTGASIHVSDGAVLLQNDERVTGLGNA